MRSELPAITVVFSVDPRDSRTFWEYEWLREVFRPGPYPVQFRVDAARRHFTDDALLVVHRPDTGPERTYIEEYTRRGLRFGLIHLGDEWLKDERHAAYQNETMRVVFRNYWRPSYPESSPRVVAFPLGCKSGFVQALEGRALARTAADRPHLWSFAGRIVRSERQRAIAAVRTELGAGYEHSIPVWDAPTSLSTQDYAALMLDSLFVPIPVGNVNIECFRMYEALEAGCIPIAVESTDRQPHPYYRRLFQADDLPFPQIRDWETDLPQLGLSRWSPEQREEVRVACYTWYQERKRRTRSRVHRALVQAFGGREPLNKGVVQ